MLRFEQPENEKVFDNLWLGIAAILLIIQIIHIFFSISAYISLTILSIGILYAFVIIMQNRQSIFEEMIAHRRLLFLLIIIAGSYTVWLASRGMLKPTIPDSGYYHLSTIRWINEYPLIFGLGNLYTHLAFNQSFFSFVAFLNIFPYFNKGYNIANSFFILIVFLECLSDTIKLILSSYKYGRWSVAKMFSVLMVPVVILCSLTLRISSPTVDIPIFFIQIILMLHLLKLIECDTKQESQMSELKFIIILAFSSVTLKLSTAVFSLLLFSSAIIYVSLQSKSFTNTLKRISFSIIISLIILTVWGGRGVVQSGYPLFPSTLISFETDWSVPLGTAKSVKNSIYSFARQRGKPMSEVLGNWKWLYPWLAKISTDMSARTDMYVRSPFILFFFGFISLLFVIFLNLLRKNKGRLCLPSLIGYIPILGGLAFWFFTAPNPRFVGSLLWLLSVLTFVNICSIIVFDKAKLLSIIIFTGLLFWPIWQNQGLFKYISLNGYQPIKKPQLIQKTTNHGLTLYLPTKGERGKCWNSPLPCTPHYNPNLRLRGDSLKDGFTLKVTSNKSR